MTENGLSVRRFDGPRDVAAIADLCWAYRDFLLGLGPPDRAMIETFYPVKKYQQIVDRIEVEHAPPRGVALLARQDGHPVGCGMVQSMGPGDAEIKRVFVREGAQGNGIGRAIMNALIAECRTLGFERILMDTSQSLTRAATLYRSLGFVDRGPYQPIPDIASGKLLFFEMTL